MIDRDNNFISKFVIVLSVIVFLELINIVMNLYVNINDDISYNVVDMLFIIKFIGIVTLFISMYIWSRNKDNNLLKEQLLIHTKYVLMISIFYFLILYLFKYSIVLNAMDILRNKMIEGNPALLLNFSIYTYNTLKYVKGVFQSLNSEFILMIELLFIVWNLRNLMTLKTKKEDVVYYDSFLYNNNLKYFSLALILTSFLSINLFKYEFELIEAMMFLVSFFLFSISIPLHSFIRDISNMQRNKSTKSDFTTLHRLSSILSLAILVGAVIYLGLVLYGFTVGIGSYRIIPTFVSIAISGFISFNVMRTRRLLEE